MSARIFVLPLLPTATRDLAQPVVVNRIRRLLLSRGSCSRPARRICHARIWRRV